MKNHEKNIDSTIEMHESKKATSLQRKKMDSVLYCQNRCRILQIAFKAAEFQFSFADHLTWASILNSHLLSQFVFQEFFRDE